MREIPLTRGYTALVDDEDFDELMTFHWCVRTSSDGTIYAQRAIALGKYRVSSVLMHRHIMQAPRGSLVDHRDRNGLHNFRSNLRLCDHSQSVTNRVTKVIPASGYRGVYQTRRPDRWTAAIEWRGKRYSLGQYSDAAEAALAYDAAARKIHGEFAVFNFLLSASA